MYQDISENVIIIGATLDDVNENSVYHIGKPWMQRPLNEVEGDILKNVNDIKLKAAQVAEVKHEHMKPETDPCYSAYHTLLSTYITKSYVVKILSLQ